MQVKNGFRVPPQASKNEQMRELQVELKNQEMANRISQMMIKQLMENIKSMSEDLGFALNQLSELQYNYGALQKHFNVSAETLNNLANAQRLVDFNEATAKEDAKEGLLPVNEISADSIITLTSEAKDENGKDRGIFRSRIKLSESGSADLIANLTGKKVGDKVQVKLNGIEHTVEVLSVKNAPVVEAAVASETIQ